MGLAHCFGEGPVGVSSLPLSEGLGWTHSVCADRTLPQGHFSPLSSPSLLASLRRRPCFPLNLSSPPRLPSTLCSCVSPPAPTGGREQGSEWGRAGVGSSHFTNCVASGKMLTLSLSFLSAKWV